MVVYVSHEEQECLVRVAELVAGARISVIYCDYEFVVHATYLTGDDGEFRRKQWGMWCEARPCCGRVVRGGRLQE